MVPTLTTERLILRQIDKKDAPNIFANFSNEQVTKYYGMKNFETVKEAEQLISAFTTSLEQKRGMRWAIERKESPGLIGTIGFNLWSPVHRRAEVGYEIHPDYWRSGYVSEALQTVVAYGFQELQLTRIGAVVFVENEASNQLLLKQGFEKEGVMKKYLYQNNQAHDVNIFAKVNMDTATYFL